MAIQVTTKEDISAFRLQELVWMLPTSELDCALVSVDQLPGFLGDMRFAACANLDSMELAGIRRLGVAGMSHTSS